MGTVETDGAGTAGGRLGRWDYGRGLGVGCVKNLDAAGLRHGRRGARRGLKRQRRLVGMDANRSATPLVRERVR